MMVATRAVFQSLGRLALWLMPLTVIYEWVGGTFAKSMFERALYLALFFCLFWLSELPQEAPEAAPTKLAKLRLPLGAGLLALGALALGTAVGWLVLPRLGLSPLLPPDFVTPAPRRLMLPLIAAWPLALGSSLVRERRLGPRSYERLGSFLGLGFLVHFASGVHVQALPVLGGRAAPWLLALAALVLLALALVPRGSFALRLSALVGLGLALRVLGIFSWQIDPVVRDMLALVESAQDRFAAGDNPYRLYAMQQGSELPLTYFPGLWLGYGLPRLFGLDLRFMGTLAEGGLFALLALLARRTPAAQRAWAEAFVYCFAALWLFSPSVQWNAIYAEPTLWWGLLGALLALAFSGRFTAAAIALGYAVATRHFAIVLAPFVLLYFVRTRGLRGALPYLAISGCVAALLLTPFVCSDPELFWFGTFRWLREYGPAHLSWFFDRFGFMQPFAEHDALALLPMVQAGLVGACFVGALLAKREHIASFAATAALLFIMFNVLLWDSFLLDGAIAAAAVILTREKRAEPLAQVAPLSRTVRDLSISGLVLTLLSGAYLAYTLVRTLHPQGREDAREYMIANVRAGDFIIDRSDRRIAFVTGSWLLRHEDVPAPIGGELYDGAWGGRSAMTSPRHAWLVTETARDHALRSSFGVLGLEQAYGDFDGYQVQSVLPHKAQRVLPSALPPGAGLLPCQVGWANQEMLGVLVQRGESLSLAFPRPQNPAPRARVALALGFPNGDTVWPRKEVHARLASAAYDAEFTVENLAGLQWHAWPAPALPADGPVRLELSTDDPLPRLVCLELSWLEGA
jgi:hypothetical protein